jgi:hypothetical protein
MRSLWFPPLPHGCEANPRRYHFQGFGQGPDALAIRTILVDHTGTTLAPLAPYWHHWHHTGTTGTILVNTSCRPTYVSGAVAPGLHTGTVPRASGPETRRMCSLGSQIRLLTRRGSHACERRGFGSLREVSVGVSHLFLEDGILVFHIATAICKGFVGFRVSTRFKDRETDKKWQIRHL